VTDFYFPGKKFPSFSITGAECQLKCAHCDGHYLKGMIPVWTSGRLFEEALKLEQRGGRGFLLSGGCDLNGHVPLDSFYEVIAMIKDKTNLKVNVHTGLLYRGEAEALANAGVDAVSIELIGSEETIREVCNLRRTPTDYENCLLELKDVGVNVVPHICVGLNFGQVKGEYDALEVARDNKTKTLVVTSLLPTKGTKMANLGREGNQTVDFVRKAREALPWARILIGCMRPRGESDMEIASLEAGADGIVLPSRKTVSHVRNYRIIEECCALI